MDLLTDVLRNLSLRGTVYFRADFRAPWGMEIGGNQVAAFHVVARGSAWLRTRDEAPERLEPGDIVLFPHGARHALMDRPDTPAPPAPELLAEPGEQDGATVFGGEGEPTTLICGHFEYDHEAEHPLFRTLPERILLHVRDSADAAWIRTATELAAAECASGREGSSAVVDRLAEVLLVQVLRSWVDSGAGDAGFLAAVADEHLRRALTLVHESPERPWSVEDLARASGMSRSTFSERFRDRVGETPMRYLTRWRMRLAQTLLATSASLGDIAEQVGYDSEWAFAKAFKRVFGEGPGAARRRLRQSASLPRAHA